MHALFVDTACDRSQPRRGRHWLLSLCGLWAGLAQGQLTTPHDLAAGAAIDDRSVCVFCHVPSAGAAAQQPSWSRGTGEKVPRFETLEALGTEPEDGGRGPGSSSLVCIACHDGLQAPSVSAAPAHGDGHPVGVPYAGERSVLATGQRWDESDFEAPARAVVNGRPTFWIDVDSRAGRQKADLFMPARSDERPYVECATCHDPHGTPNRAFLRVTHEGGRICMSCHNL